MQSNNYRISSSKPRCSKLSQNEFAIGRRQLYILPTRIGWYYALILVALFAIAVKFDNQPAFMMLFVLASIGLVAMLYTHNNVIGLSIKAQPTKPVFVGETAEFPVLLSNPSTTVRRAVWIICAGFHRLVDLQAEEEVKLILTLPTLRRGYLNCADINFTSQFPIGIFFCWTKRFSPTQRCLVYPQPLDLVPLPLASSDNAQLATTTQHRRSGEDYSGMKPYQAGDRLRDVHWPSLAKTGKLVTIEHQDMTGDALRISWFNLPNTLSTEDRISQLCQWVIDAEQANLRYQLELPNHTEQFAHGDIHFHKCLTTLALWQAAETSHTEQAAATAEAA